MPTLFEDEEVVLYPLRRRRGTGEDAEMVIADTSFVRCRLLGPIHLRFDEDVLVDGCSFTPAAEDCVVAIPADEPYVGAFRVAGCSFLDCEFEDVKLVVPAGAELLAGQRTTADALA